MGPEYLFPHPDRDAYPALAGPDGRYPREANVRPVWEGGGPEYVPLAPKDTEAAPEDHSPIITSRETYETWEEAWYPSGPRGFAKRARAAGWEARIGFSRGYIPGARADTWEVRDMIGVWVDGYGRRACALWERNPEAEFSARKLEAGIKPGETPSGMAWKASGTSVLLGGGMAWTYATVADLDAWVSLKGAVLPTWYEHIQAWVQAHDEQTKRKAKAKTQAEADAREEGARAR